MKIKTFSSRETKKKGVLLAKKIKAPALIAIKGDLGSGKTTFLKGFAKGLGIKEEVQSPTFVIFKKYKTQKGKFYHFDAYRISDEDLSSLRFKEILSSKESIVAIEWSENIEKSLPLKRIEIHFRFVNRNERELIIKEINGKLKGSSRARGSAG